MAEYCLYNLTDIFLARIQVLHNYLWEKVQSVTYKNLFFVQQEQSQHQRLVRVSLQVSGKPTTGRDESENLAQFDFVNLDQTLGSLIRGILL